MSPTPTKSGMFSRTFGLLILLALLANGAVSFIVHRDISRLGAYLRSIPDRELPEPLLAGRAADLAEMARSKNESELARFYLMNAVARQPGNISLLARLADWTAGQEGAGLEELDRVQSVLQLAAYQVDPGEIPRVLELVDKIDAAKQGAIEGPGEIEPRDPGREWQELRQRAPGSVMDADAVAGYIEQLRGFAEGLAGAVTEADREREEEVARELSRWGRIARVAGQCRYVDNCLAKLGEGADLSSQKSVSIVQAAENALPGFWGEDLAGFPEELISRIDSYPGTIQAKVAEIGAARSRPILAEIEAIAAKSLGEDEPWEAWCKFREGQIKDVQSLMVQVSSQDGLQQAQSHLEKMGMALRKLRSGQHNKYQRWALETVKGAFDSYQGFRPSLNNLAFTSEDAEKILDETPLLQVDQSLLSPEVSRMYNDVIQKLFDTFSPEQLVAWEKKIGESAKKKLEDF